MFLHGDNPNVQNKPIYYIIYLLNDLACNIFTYKM